MIIIPISPQAGRGLADAMMVFERRFVRWAIPVWLLCGVAGFLGWGIVLHLFMPGLVEHWPRDWIELTLFALMLVLCLLGGPLALAGIPFAFTMFGLCSWLIR